MKKVAVITGGSSGIGSATAQVLARAGYVVYELSRSGSDQSGIRHLFADVSDEVSVTNALQHIEKTEGHIDLAVSNAGFGISGTIEFTPAEQAKRLFEVNFFGAAAFARLVLPYLRSTKGRLIFVGSVAGLVAIPFQGYYSASKAALSSLCESLRSEVKPFGLSVCCILPGDIKTGFTDTRDRSFQGDDLYGQRISRSVAVMEKDEQNGMPPEAVGHAVLRIARKGRVAPQYTIGLQYQLIVLLLRLLPRAFARCIVDVIYAR